MPTYWLRFAGGEELCRLNQDEGFIDKWFQNYVFTGEYTGQEWGQGGDGGSISFRPREKKVDIPDKENPEKLSRTPKSVL